MISILSWIDIPSKVTSGLPENGRLISSVKGAIFQAVS